MGHILVVDPSLLDRKRIRIVLEAAAHTVAEVASPTQALAELQKMGKGDLQMMITELQFPEGGGVEFIRHLKQEPALQTIPVVVCTAQPPREQVIELISSGVSTIVTKPFGGELLLRRVTETLAEASKLAQGEGARLSWNMEDYLRRELKRAERSRSPFSLIAVQTLGETRRQAVPLLMRALVRQMRETDVLVRLGDDQVVIMLPDTDAAGAAVVARRIGEVGEGLAVGLDGEESMVVAVQTGTATYPTEVADGERLITMACERASGGYGSAPR